MVDWTLAVLNIVTGEMTQPRSLGHEPRGVSIFGNAAGRPVLFLATDDRILTYTLSPMRASRFYNSPGKNVAIAGAFLLLLAQGPGEWAINPEHKLGEAHS